MFVTIDDLLGHHNCIVVVNSVDVALHMVLAFDYFFIGVIVEGLLAISVAHERASLEYPQLLKIIDKLIELTLVVGRAREARLDRISESKGGQLAPNRLILHEVRTHDT